MSELNTDTNEIIPDDSLDCTGLYCPVPLYQSRKKLDNLKPGQILKVVADDPTTEPDFKAWMKTTGNEMIKFIKENDKFIYYIKKTEKK